MARTVATAGYLTNATVFSNIISTSLGTIAIWIRPTGAASNATNVYDLPSAWADPGQNIGILRGTVSAGTDQIWAYGWDGAEKKVGSTFTNTAWNHAVWLHSGGNLFLYLNGTSAGSVAAGNIVVSGTVRIGSGNGAAQGFTGSFANFASWNVALTADEITALSRGMLPHRVRPGSLTTNVPVWGTHSPEIDLVAGRPNWTVTGTATIATTAPPVQPFSRHFWNQPVLEIAAPAGGRLLNVNPLDGLGNYYRGGAS